MRQITKSFEEVCCLTVLPIGLFKHIKQETHLAQEAGFVKTFRGGVMQCQIANERGELHNLQQGICIAVRNMRLQPREPGLVIVPTDLH